MPLKERQNKNSAHQNRSKTYGLKNPKNIAQALEVSLDYLAGGSDKVNLDKRTLKLIDDIEKLEPSIKDKLYFLANAIIRDAKTGKAYQQ